MDQSVAPNDMPLAKDAQTLIATRSADDLVNQIMWHCDENIRNPGHPFWQNVVATCREAIQVSPQLTLQRNAIVSTLCWDEIHNALQNQVQSGPVSEGMLEDLKDIMTALEARLYPNRIAMILPPLLQSLSSSMPGTWIAEETPASESADNHQARENDDESSLATPEVAADGNNQNETSEGTKQDVADKSSISLTSTDITTVYSYGVYQVAVKLEHNHGVEGNGGRQTDKTEQGQNKSVSMKSTLGKRSREDDAASAVATTANANAQPEAKRQKTETASWASYLRSRSFW